MYRESKAVATLFVATLLYAGHAGAQGWNETLAAAKKEGRVMVYTATVPDVIARLSEAWQKSNPDIKLEYLRGTCAAVCPRLEQERATGADGADIYLTTEVNWLVTRSQEGALKGLDALPLFKSWPSKWVLGNYGVVVGLEPNVIAYNTSLVKTKPTGYLDLLRPEYTGKLGVTTAPLAILAAFYDWAEKAVAPDFAERLAAQRPLLALGAVPLTQSVASGEVIATAFSVPSTIGPLKERGAPIEMVLPKPAFGIRYVVSVLGWSKRPNAGMLFANWLMSREGQQVWHGRGESASPIAGIPGSIDVDVIGTFFDPLAYPPNVAKERIAKWESVLKRRAESSASR